MTPAGGNRQMLYLYGDPAYHLSHGVISPYGLRKQISQRKLTSIMISRRVGSP
jgi:hypothetical protein